MTGPRARPARTAGPPPTPVALALIPVRNGVLPLGAVETTAEAGGHCWLLGSRCDRALAELTSATASVHLSEAGRFDPARWTALTAPILTHDRCHLLLPGSPDGRDLAPRLAAALERPLLTGVVELGADRAVVASHGGRVMDTRALTGPVVAVLRSDAGAISPVGGGRRPEPIRVDLIAPASTGTADLRDRPTRRADDATRAPVGPTGTDAVGWIEAVADIPADPATVDLAEAPRIVAVGAGLGDEDQIETLVEVAARLEASIGATRAVTDRGWMPEERQIGLAATVVDPDLYLAVGISGAAPHTAGLGSPRHLVAVNTDPWCPLMDVADLALVCDGPAFLRALVDEIDRRAHDRPGAEGSAGC